MQAPEEDIRHYEKPQPAEPTEETWNWAQDCRDPEMIYAHVTHAEVKSSSDDCLKEFPVCEIVSPGRDSRRHAQKSGGFWEAAKGVWNAVFNIEAKTGENGKPTEVIRTQIKMGSDDSRLREVRTTVNLERLEHDDGRGTRIVRHGDGSVHAVSKDFEFHRIGDRAILRGPDGREITRQLTPEGKAWWSTIVDGTKIDVTEKVEAQYQRVLARLDCKCAPRANEPHDHPGDGTQPVVTAHDDAVSATDQNGNVITLDTDGNALIRARRGKHVHKFLITKDNQIFGFNSDGTQRKLTDTEEGLIKLTTDGKIEINGVKILTEKGITKAITSDGIELKSEADGARAHIPKGAGENGDVTVRTGKRGDKEVTSKGGAQLSMTPDRQLTIRNGQEQVEYEYSILEGTMRAFIPGKGQWFSYDGQGNFRLWNGYLIKRNGEIEDEDGQSLSGPLYQQASDYGTAIGIAQTVVGEVNGKDPADMDPGFVSAYVGKLESAAASVSDAIQRCMDRSDLLGLYQLYCMQTAIQSAQSRIQHVSQATHEAYRAGLPANLQQEAARRSVGGYAGNPDQIIADLHREEEERQSGELA